MTDNVIIEYRDPSENIQKEFSCFYFYEPSLHSQCHPCFYLEALAIGRLIIKNGFLGSTHKFINYLNGNLISLQDCNFLAEARCIIIEKSMKKIEKMGYERFQVAKKKYNENKLNQFIFEIIRD